MWEAQCIELLIGRNLSFSPNISKEDFLCMSLYIISLLFHSQILMTVPRDVHPAV